ncbi:MAG: SDR family NAD(P)-dependent oxidoreductase [Dehalococcoidales bacterium]
MLVKDKVAIVTGGGRGIGKAISLTLAREGADVAVFGRTMETLEQTAKEIKALGRKALAIRTDVSDSSQVNQSVQKILEVWGKIDILVNNAAILPHTVGSTTNLDEMNPILDTNDEQWAEQIAVDLTGPFYCMRAVLKPMIEQRSGSIISIGSLSGQNGGYFSTPSYSAAKAGIVGLTMLAARWVGKYGINVNVVNPGPVKTEGAVFSSMQLEFLCSTIPFRRGGVETEVFGLPQDIADAVLFLASSRAAFITGTCINVLGGQKMG